MLKYTTTSILFLIILITLVIEIQYGRISAWMLLIPILLYLPLLILGSARIGFNFYFNSLTKIRTDQKVIAITFDDGPHPSLTSDLLNLLDKHQATATFFCIGNKIEEHPEIIKMIDEKGHLLGNHSYTHHRFFDLFSTKKMVDEINLTSDVVEKTIGKRPILFRPPYGVTNPMLRNAVLKTKVISIGWSLRSFDTIRDEESVMKKLKSKTKPGQVILFHDTSATILQTMDEYLKWLNSKGYKVVSLEQMFNIQAYEVD